ncbi:hypothetical protein Mapa_013518 [Marchantia paleacea]|nr:hypothetical protein Mapa_013518 [Marchantia paleacea]
MARWFVPLLCRPKPDGCFESYGGILCHTLWFCQNAFADGSPACSIVVVPNRKSTMGPFSAQLPLMQQERTKRIFTAFSDSLCTTLVFPSASCILLERRQESFRNVLAILGEPYVTIKECFLSC